MMESSCRLMSYSSLGVSLYVMEFFLEVQMLTFTVLHNKQYSFVQELQSCSKGSKGQNHGCHSENWQRVTTMMETTYLRLPSGVP